MHILKCQKFKSNWFSYNIAHHLQTHAQTHKYDMARLKEYMYNISKVPETIHSIIYLSPLIAPPGKPFHPFLCVANHLALV